MTSSFGNGAHAVAPSFEGARITPEQAEAFAAAFLPSWEADGGVATSAAANGHAGGDLRTTMKSNGVHAESHAPPSRTRVSEPEDSVVIDRSITADQIAAPPPDSGRVPVAPVATVRLAPPPAPMAAPAVASVPAPPPPSLRPMPPPSMRPMPPPRPARSVARSPSIDDDVQAPKSKKGLFIGLGVAAAAALAVVIGIAVNSGDAAKADDSGGPTITVVKPADTAKPPAAPPTATQTATTTPVAAVTTPPTPVTALPVAASPDPPARPKTTRTTAAQPTYNAPPPQPRAAQPRSGGGSAIVKDVPF